ncbi:ferrochelatase [Shewanella benthica]|uniref:Ferrochelatase n=2 Tax=Shewanella benthica TaxID=43661 RepID=A0A330M5E0_9GAMM|nr:ferrochelatase [Shewanella benthica]EDP99800.1 ferrochelatase [Shewanella benthica KT99]SQH77185.1 ferrochelatase [Shewanella benthica]
MSKTTPAFGVLLVNLGTPDTPTTKDVRSFLKQFLSDPRVVDLNPLIWKPILNGVILNFRPSKVAKLYQSIWWDEGSPLMVVSQRQRELLAGMLAQVYGQSIPVELGMTYGNPSLALGLDKLKSQGVERIIVLPLYPQYSCSTVAAVSDAIATEYKGWREVPETRINKEYYQHPGYILALASSVKAHWERHGQADKLLMSFHGIPVRYVTEGDPYQGHCEKTSELLAKALGLNRDQWQLCYQSIFGKEEWLTPQTDKTLTSLPTQGVKSVDIISPAFAADCLETLEELSIGGKERFIAAGGERYEFIPCLNTDPAHIALLVELVKQQSQGWC